jgi:hypothetical protein
MIIYIWASGDVNYPEHVDDDILDERVPADAGDRKDSDSDLVKFEIAELNNIDTQKNR